MYQLNTCNYTYMNVSCESFSTLFCSVILSSMFIDFRNDQYGWHLLLTIVMVNYSI